MGDVDQGNVTAVEETEQDLETLHKRLDYAVEFLYPDELELATEIIEGLVRGQSKYGPLEIDGDPRDFQEEAAEEMRDWFVYQAAEVIRRKRRLRRMDRATDTISEDPF